ncbi:MAG: UDP-N-acetylmuramoylalanine--D-glutamate ligase [Pedosphaera sp.]|nr:UDP-N-acetylmuramoylalanine--D-glutamate ligase [Pedosphaera sp.]
MYELENKQVLVIGLGARGRAACELLRGSGANVMAVDEADTEELRAEAGRLRPLGVEVELGATVAPNRQFSLAVVSPAVPGNTAMVLEMRQRKVPLIGEFELGFQQAKCLSIAVAGTNGKGTTAELIEHLLAHNHRKIELCGHGSRPVCSVALETKELDFLVLQVNSFQLETTQFFRPAVAVLMNLAPDHLDRYASHADYVRANARLFQNQQPFDWAIVQSEALAQLRSLDLPMPSKVITFSANNRRADIYMERGLIMSRLPDWSWPLLNLDECQLQGSHNAENLMAALAVGHVLRLPLDAMVSVLKAERPGPHRFERVAELNGVQFINDSKATNVDALQKALLSLPGTGGEPNVWLIAGGKDKGLEYYDVGPLLSQRVKGAFLIGEAREKIRAAWSLFTPCTAVSSLLEAVSVAAKNAVSGDVILFSPACSSFDQFRNYQHRGEVFRQAVNELTTPTRSGSVESHPNAPAVNTDKLQSIETKNK